MCVCSAFAPSNFLVFFIARCGSVTIPFNSISMQTMTMQTRQSQSKVILRYVSTSSDSPVQAAGARQWNGITKIIERLLPVGHIAFIFCTEGERVIDFVHLPLLCNSNVSWHSCCLVNGAVERWAPGSNKNVCAVRLFQRLSLISMFFVVVVHLTHPFAQHKIALDICRFRCD